MAKKTESALAVAAAALAIADGAAAAEPNPDAPAPAYTVAAPDAALAADGVAALAATAAATVATHAAATDVPDGKRAYTVTSVAIRHNGAQYEVNAEIRLTDAEADRLGHLVMRRDV